MSRLQALLSAANRARKKKFPAPFLGRKKYDALHGRYQGLVEALASPANPLRRSAALRCLQAYAQQHEDTELCLFVSYAATPLVKPHVQRHIDALIGAGIDVVLIINTDTITAELPCFSLSKNLSGLYLRENMGFDFGAWSHIYSILNFNRQVTRLYLVNDSIIGPLSENMFKQMVTRIRASHLDFIGLTSNREPMWHLQSFFLVLGPKILKNCIFDNYFKTLLQLPSKEMVIDFYETRLTSYLINMGFSTGALFPVETLATEKSDTVIHHPERLLDEGFPYLKYSISKKPPGLTILQTYTSGSFSD